MKPQRRGSKALQLLTYGLPNVTLVVEKLTVQVSDITDQTASLKAVFHRRPGLQAQLPPPGRIIGEGRHRSSKGVGVSKGNERAEVGTGNHVANPADIGTDRSDTGGHRLNQSNRRSLVARGQHENVGCAVNGLEIASPAEKSRLLLDAELLRLPSKVDLQVSITNNQEDKTTGVLDQPCRHLKKKRLVLDGRKTTNRRDDKGIVRDLECSPRFHPIGRGQGQQSIEVEAQRNKPNLSSIAYR